MVKRWNGRGINSVGSDKDGMIKGEDLDVTNASLTYSGR